MLLGIILFYTMAATATAHHRIKKATNLAKLGHLPQAITLLQQQSPVAGNTESYNKILGSLSLATKDYKTALEAFRKAAIVTTTPDLYMQIGKCEQALNEYEKAVIAYQTASFMHPNLIAPRFALLSVYLQQQDTTKAINIAQEIVIIEPKIKNSESEKLKKKAADIIKN